MEFLNSLTDDQVALLGCAAALISTGTLMCLSYYLGRHRTMSPGRVAAAVFTPVETMTRDKVGRRSTGRNAA